MLEPRDKHEEGLYQKMQVAHTVLLFLGGLPLPL